MYSTRFTLTMILGLLLSNVAVGQTAPQLPASNPPANSVQEVSPTEAAGQLIRDAQASFARIRDYSCMFYKQERVNGQLLPEQTIQMRVRQQPFSVYMKWVGPKNMASQEACYVSGKNNNMLRAKSASGIASALGFISIDPRDSKAMATNRHSITEAGLGHLIENMARNYDMQVKLAPDQGSISFAEYRFLNKPCIRLESIRRVNNGQFYAYRTVVYLDKETRMPVRIEAYDWPKQGAPASGELVECYSYVDLKFNVGLTDASFNY